MGNDINNEDEIHTFDLIIQETGGFGRFQQMILVLSLISSVVAACNHLSPIYLTYTPCFDCIDNLDLNGSDFPCQENYQVRLPKNLISKVSGFKFFSVHHHKMFKYAINGNMIQVFLNPLLSLNLIWFVIVPNFYRL